MCRVYTTVHPTRTVRHGRRTLVRPASAVTVCHSVTLWTVQSSRRVVGSDTSTVSAVQSVKVARHSSYLPCSQNISFTFMLSTELCVLRTEVIYVYTSQLSVCYTSLHCSFQLNKSRVNWERCRSTFYMNYLVNYLVWPHQQDAHQRGLGLSGSIHEEAHPIVSNFS